MSSSKPPVHFDDYIESYDSNLDYALSITGESREYYAKGRISWSAECVKELGLSGGKVLDFGCGDGSNAPLLINLFSATELIGVDVSSGSIARARETSSLSKASFYEVNEFAGKGEFDIAYCNGVFHHIPMQQRDAAMQYVFDALRPGGLFAFWENNPFNPGTRYIMARCEFDRDAVMLTPAESVQRLGTAGFHIIRKDSLFYFPASFKLFRSLEKRLARILLGGQYHILAKKPQ
jgi:SAM-dependent methyltransferase